MKFWVILVLGAALGWGSAQVIGKLALKEIGPIQFNFIRFSAVAIPVFLAAVATESLKGIGFNQVTLAAIISGILGWFLAAGLYFYSMKREAAHRIIPAGNSYPFWVILLAPLFLGEIIKFAVLISAGFIFLGIYLLSSRKEEEASWKWGVPTASFVAFLWGTNSILNKYCLNAGMGIISLLAVRVVSALILFAVASALLGNLRELRFRWKSVKLSILSGIVAFLFGSTLYLSALQMEQVSTLIPITGTTVLFGFLLSVPILGEKPTWKSTLGMISVLVGVFLLMV